MSFPEFEQVRRLSQAESQTVLRSEISLKERFFRYFQHEITGMLHDIHTVDAYWDAGLAD